MAIELLFRNSTILFLDLPGYQGVSASEGGNTFFITSNDARAIYDWLVAGLDRREVKIRYIKA